MMKSRKLLLFRNIVILVLSLVFLAGGGACLYADSLLNRIHYVLPNESETSGENLFQTASTQSGANAKSGIVGGLYHDDAVINILMLGTDDYQQNDVGRSDSMMLVSVDTRHKKLKITSFMRDMYVAVPGLGSHKLCEAYSLSGGQEKGIRKVILTLEANFGIDIDRFVKVDFSKFPGIIDRLGGVEIKLTNETNSNGITEAGLINAYSGDSRKVRPGVVNNLSGLQARYYSRIRDIGNDQERTERQRKVFTSAVNKMKSSNLLTIYGVLHDTFPLILTNMQKNEIEGMLANSLTYLNYPLSQNRVPAEGEYTNIKNEAGDCLGVDLDKCRQTLAKFIYENDIPSGSYS
ncbi:MAG TPA: LCP family protein [Caproicibacter sp.]|nr:LCP family protein [Caproicibacter sp.]